MKTYAIADVVPEGCANFTAGKEYETFWHDDQYFIMEDDNGDRMSPAWKDSSFLGFGSWRRVERES